MSIFQNKLEYTHSNGGKAKEWRNKEQDERQNEGEKEASRKQSKDYQ